ncbi:peptide deformylase [Streptomyces sp. x-80]|uniref:peptide deformylase n=1 Tax=Streptomyces sp. x-80 TaxID=2789282 RepID=UPI00397F24C9
MPHIDLIKKVDEVLDGPSPLCIVSAGDPVLRREAFPFDGQLDDGRLHHLVEAMRETMQKTKGAVGLAAPQVGIPLQLAVLGTSRELDVRLTEQGEKPVPFTVLINPSYKPVDTRHTASFEGCLSVPGWQAVVIRTDRIELTCDDEAGRRVEEEYSGLAARIMQHEIDHLAGTLYLDRAEIRSLSSLEEAIQRWRPAGLEVAARELGFTLPGPKSGG